MSSEDAPIHHVLVRAANALIGRDIVGEHDDAIERRGRHRAGVSELCRLFGAAPLVPQAIEPLKLQDVEGTACFAGRGSSRLRRLPRYSGPTLLW
jgi:hypothetical protein